MTDVNKKKKHEQHLNRWIFTVLWTVFGALGWAVFIAATFIFDMQDNFLQWFFVVGGIPALMLTPVQHYLIKHRLGYALRRWIPLSMLGWLIGALGFLLLMPGVGSNIDPLYLIMAWFMPVFALQTWALRRVSNSAWLWMLAGLASTLVFLRSGVETSDDIGSWALAGGLQSLITALILLWIQRDGLRSRLQSKSKDMSHLTTDAADEAQAETHLSSNYVQQRMFKR